MSRLYTAQLAFAKDIALVAGEQMLASFGKHATISTKADGSLVTEVDRRINDVLIGKSKEHFPSYSVMGEEASHEVREAPYTWVCDPIDGTVPYTLGVPTNVFSLALVDASGQPVVAVVYDPYLRNLFWAVIRGATHCNDTAIRVNTVPYVKDAFIGISGRTSKVLDAGAFKTELTTTCAKPIITYSAIYEATLVATGKIAATIIMGDGAHDAAAAKLLVEAAGGRVTDLFGSDQRYDMPTRGVILSNGLMHDELVAMARSYQL